MKLRVKSGIVAAAVLLFAAGLMLAHFAAEEAGYTALTTLSASPVTAGVGHQVQAGQININSATVEELDKLPGIGPAKAEAIAAWRLEYGPFRYPEELILVPGIGEGILMENLDLITTGGE